MWNTFNEAERREVPDDLLLSLRRIDFGDGNDRYTRVKAMIREVTAPILRSLQNRDLVVRPEFVGGSFEGTKTGVSDFDVLVILDGCGLISVEMSPQFSTLRAGSSDNPAFSGLLTNRGLVDPRKVRSKLQSWIMREINLHSSDFNVRRGQYACQAITLEIEPKPSSMYRDVGTISVDLVPAFQVSDLYFVAKPCRQEVFGSAGAVVLNREIVWRKSFFLHEKQMFKYIDRDGGCRRECVKILTYLRQRDAPLKYLASYHYKVLVLKECARYPAREDWAANRLAERLWGSLKSLLCYLGNGRLPHVLDPRINIFDTVSDKTALENTRVRVQRLLNQGSVGIRSILDTQAGTKKSFLSFLSFLQASFPHADIYLICRSDPRKLVLYSRGLRRETDSKAPVLHNSGFSHKPEEERRSSETDSKAPVLHNSGFSHKPEEERRSSCCNFICSVLVLVLIVIGGIALTAMTKKP